MDIFLQLIKNIEKARRLAFPEFDQITLEPRAVQILANLFLNPDCKSNIDLSKFISPEPVKLNQLSPHIITAAPSTLAKYAQDHQQLNITENDILRCFALDHVKTVQVDKIRFSSSQKLSHLLNIGQVVKSKKIGRKKIVDLEKIFNNQKILFKNIFIPDNLEIFKNQEVFYHFGVVVAVVKNQKLAELSDEIKVKQIKNHSIYRINREAKEKSKSIIDSQNKTLFHENLMEKIILPKKLQAKI